MTCYSDEIKSLNDFRNNLVELTFDFEYKKNEEEIKLIALLKNLYKIPNEADITINYDMDKEVLGLESNVKLNVHDAVGFNLIKTEEYKCTDYNTGFKNIQSTCIFKYYFTSNYGGIL